MQAWRLHTMGVQFTYEDHELRVPAIIRDDLLMIREVLAELAEEERENQ